jgi:serine phosphatase RsbU (regulator of sigma subunit)
MSWSHCCAMPLGLVDNPQLEIHEIVLPPDATFVLYTDGVNILVLQVD